MVFELNTIWCLLVFLGRFMKCSILLQITMFSFGEDLASVMLFSVCVLFSSMHWRVGRRRGSWSLTSMQPSVGTVAFVQSILAQFLSHQSRYVIVDSYLSKLVKVVFGVPRGSFFPFCC